MPVTDVQHDPDNLTLTITADFAAPVARIWRCTPTLVNWRRCGGPRPTRRPSSTTASHPAVARRIS